jgi:hypothetical protein
MQSDCHPYRQTKETIERFAIDQRELFRNPGRINEINNKENGGK